MNLRASFIKNVDGLFNQQMEKIQLSPFVPNWMVIAWFLRGSQGPLLNAKFPYVRFSRLPQNFKYLPPLKGAV